MQVDRGGLGQEALAMQMGTVWPSVALLRTVALSTVDNDDDHHHCDYDQ